ncbi:hypothetical protein Mterra_02588 [Calidithermus terrae]|uniref:Uncharacterized protein n=1 Tax=Calidithermus terrae TaxID=1408545 RepID=A0A399EF97_9DEIN|nr:MULTISPECIES: hypothetical protein [Calidithermus]RIH82628.1 hypothetical protein Mterra_02588 [Calidithermus terrae]
MGERRYDAQAALVVCIRYGSVEYHKPTDLMKQAKQLGVGVIEAELREPDARTAG